jgi:hypothetical protein
MKAGIVEPETFIVRQGLGKHVPAAMNTQATMEILLGAMFSVRALAGEAEALREKMIQCHYVSHKSHMTRRGIELGPPRWETGE